MLCYVMLSGARKSETVGGEGMLLTPPVGGFYLLFSCLVGLRTLLSLLRDGLRDIGRVEWSGVEWRGSCMGYSKCI